MVGYWNENKLGIKTIISGLFHKCEIIRDPKKNYDTGNFDRYFKIGSGFDIETSRIKVGDIEASYCYQWQFSLSDLIVMGRNLDEFEEFLIFILGKIPKGIKILCYVANLGFEYNHTKRRLVKYGITRHFEKKSKQPLVIEVGKKIVFRECIGLFGRSLADIAKDFASTQKLKGDLDYSLLRLSKTPLTDKEKQYCINDVKILSELGDYTFSHYYGDFRSLPLTAIGELRDDVKEKMGNNFLKIKKEIQSWMPDDEEDYYLFRNYLL